MHVDRLKFHFWRQFALKMTTLCNLKKSDKPNKSMHLLRGKRQETTVYILHVCQVCIHDTSFSSLFLIVDLVFVSQLQLYLNFSNYNSDKTKSF